MIKLTIIFIISSESADGLAYVLAVTVNNVDLRNILVGSCKIVPSASADRAE